MSKNKRKSYKKEYLRLKHALEKIHRESASILLRDEIDDLLGRPRQRPTMITAEQYMKIFEDMPKRVTTTKEKPDAKEVEKENVQQKSEDTVKETTS